MGERSRIELVKKPFKNSEYWFFFDMMGQLQSLVDANSKEKIKNNKTQLLLDEIETFFPNFEKNFNSGTLTDELIENSRKLLKRMITLASSYQNCYEILPKDIKQQIKDYRSSI